MMKVNRRLVNAMQPDKEVLRKARETRKEFREGLKLSDALLTLIIIGFGILGRFFDVDTHWEIGVGIALFIVAFLGYVALKSYEDRLNPPLYQYLDRLD